MKPYQCFFELGGHREIVAVDSIADVSNGFWITDERVSDGQSTRAFTRASDCKIWIPPGKILYVEKITIQ